MLINKYAKIYKKHKKIFTYFKTTNNKNNTKPANTRILTNTIVINNITN